MGGKVKIRKKRERKLSKSSRKEKIEGPGSKKKKDENKKIRRGTDDLQAP